MMPDCDVIANDEWTGIVSHMEHAKVLDIRPFSEPDVVHIASDHGVEPNAAMFSHDDIADHDGGLFDKA